MLFACENDFKPQNSVFLDLQKRYTRRFAVGSPSNKSSTESEGVCASRVADEVADSATATQGKESADNPHTDKINAEVDSCLAGCTGGDNRTSTRRGR